MLDAHYPTMDCLPPIYGGDDTRDLADRIEQALAQEKP